MGLTPFRISQVQTGIWDQPEDDLKSSLWRCDPSPQAWVAHFLRAAPSSSAARITFAFFLGQAFPLICWTPLIGPLASDGTPPSAAPPLISTTTVPYLVQICPVKDKLVRKKTRVSLIVESLPSPGVSSQTSTYKCFSTDGTELFISVRNHFLLRGKP